MPRIEIILPDKFVFTTTIPIRIGDINRGSHVSNVNLMAIIEEARAQFLCGCGYADVVNVKAGLGFIMGDVGIIYKNQITYGKQVITQIAAADFKNKSFDLVFELTDNVTGEEVARAKTGMLLFDYRQQEVIPLPEEMKNRLANGLLFTNT